MAAQPTETGVVPTPPLTPKQGAIRHVPGRMARVEGLRRLPLVNVSIETEVNGPFLLRSPKADSSGRSRGLLNAPEHVVIVSQNAGGKAPIRHLLRGNLRANRLVAGGLPAREHLGKMSPRETVHVVAQTVEPVAIEVAGLALLELLAVAEIGEQTLGIGDFREPLRPLDNSRSKTVCAWPNRVEAVVT